MQHAGEQFHRFNTARIVRKSLQNSTLVVDYSRRLAARLSLKPGAGLLYPGPGTTLISDLPSDQHPQQLVILDGTWHHTKTLLRDIPALQDLPRYRLAPASPSRYRIRREPNVTSLSTVEATVAALRVLEPNTRGLDQLIEAFNCMIERQLAHPKAKYAWRRHQRRNRTPLNIPSALLGDLNNVVVAYAESAAGQHGCKRAARAPIYWVAQRLGTGERFACAIQPEAPLPDSILGHWELTQEHFSDALSPAAARKSWSAFQRSGDTLAVYNQSTASLLANLSANVVPCVVLKSVDFNPQRRYGTLDALITAERLASVPIRHPGRAGKRLANAIALVQHLNAVGKFAGRKQDL